MRILFVYSTTKTIRRKKPLAGQEYIQFGYSYISSMLKSKGHQTSLLILDKKYHHSNIRLAASKVKQFSPQIVCFTSVYSEFDFIKQTAEYFRNNWPSLFLVIGGVHVSLNPDESYLETFDALCLNEGEYPVLELVEKLKTKESFFDLPNFWFRKDGRIVKNKLRPFIDPLDELPFPDREIWQEWITEPDSRMTLLLGRGCPYNCTYCCNHKLRKLTDGKYVRLRDPSNVIAELKMLCTRFPSIKSYFLEVETFATDLIWLENLCNQLAQLNASFAVPLNFSTNLRVFPNMDFEEVFVNLKKANFESVIIGVESGNERVRNKILNRHYSNENILDAVKTSRKFGIKIGLFNMVGLPGETYADFLDTVALNQQIQPDWHSTSIFFPYQGTELFEKTKIMGLLPEKMNFNDERQRALLDLPGFSRKQVQKAFDSFHYDVYKKYPKAKTMKIFVYWLQKYLGHNFMAELKTFVIRLLSVGRLKSISGKLHLNTIFQKT